jgi:YD repeat-containing protein
LVQTIDARGDVTDTRRFSLDPGGLVQAVVGTDKWGTDYFTETWKCADAETCIMSRRWRSQANALSPCMDAQFRFGPRGPISDTCRGPGGIPRADAEAVVQTNRTYTLTGPMSGLLASESYLDSDAKPTTKRSGAHRVEVEYDAKGCAVGNRSYGPGGTPVNLPEGFSSWKSVADDNCDAISTEYLSADGKSASDDAGVHKYERQYAGGRLRKESRYDGEGKPVRSQADGAHVVRYLYDDSGHLTQTAFFDLADKPVAGNAGYHALHRSYTPDGHQQSEFYTDAEGHGVADNLLGVHKYFAVSDAADHPVSLAFFDAQGRPVQDKTNRVYLIKGRWDSFGRMTSTTFWKTELQKMLRWSGEHEIRSEYDAEGRLAQRLYLAPDGKPKRNSMGLSREVIGYDSTDRMISLSYYDADRLTLIRGAEISGYARLERVFDRRDHVAELRFLGTYGEVVNASISGVAAEVQRVEFIYEGQRVVEQRLYPADGLVPVAVLDCRTVKCVDESAKGMRRLD